MVCAVVGVLAAGAPGEAYHLEDSLRGGTTVGHPVGGSFDAAGWHVTNRTDRIWYALPRLTSGSVEFTMSNVSRATIGDGEAEMFAMYEAGYGISEPVRYAPEFRENNYKCMLRIYGWAEGGREGQQKLMWGMCPGGAPGFTSCACGTSFFEEPFGGSGAWSGGPERIRIEWGSGRTRYLRNGAQVLSIDWSRTGLTFGPSELHMSLGTSRPSAVDYAILPVGAVFSDLVVDGTEGALAVCPGSVVPDAGMYDAGMSIMGTVVEVPAVEDATVEPGNAAAVYGDVRDLAVGQADAEFYVKFNVGALPGRIVSAQLILNSATDRSAEGSGASVFAAGDRAWSESTVTYATRPGSRGARLARIDGISVNERYTFNLPAGTIPTPGTYSFAVLPETSDSNSAHFDAHEVSPTRGPVLRLIIDPSMPPLDAGVAPMDAGTRPPVDAPPSLDVGGGADVASVTDLGPRLDAGTLADAGAATTDSPAAADGGATSDGGPLTETSDLDGGCGCRAAGTKTAGGWLAMATLATLLARRRRPSPRS